MVPFSEHVRRATAFLLALFLWLHFIFILNLPPGLAARCAHYLHLTGSEVVILALLVILSFASGSSFWKQCRTVLYIYAFPFVVFLALLYSAFRLLRALHHWFQAQSEINVPQPPGGRAISVAAQQPASADTGSGKERAKEAANFLWRPFRKFVFLWCVLLLFSTHVQVVWICLIVLLVHLARRIFTLLGILLFSDPYLKRALARIFDVVQAAADAVDAFTPEAPPSNELRNMWNQVRTWRIVTGFLRDEYMVTRWAWVLGTVSFGIIYLYFALLFSFAYVGIARVSGIAYSWLDSVVAAVFIPLFATELPKTISLRALGGVQFTLALTVGVSTFFRFLQKRLFVVRTAATVINDKLTGETFQQKFDLLAAKLEASGNRQEQPNAPAEKIDRKKKGRRSDKTAAGGR